MGSLNRGNQKIREASPTRWHYQSFKISTISIRPTFAQEIGAITSFTECQKTVPHEQRLSLVELNQALVENRGLKFLEILGSNNKNSSGVRIIEKPNNFFKKLAKFFTINHKTTKAHDFEFENKNICHRK